MWRVIVAVLVLGFAAYRFVGKLPANGAGAAAGQPVYEGYLELRMLMNTGQREIELVAVEEKPYTADCEKRDAGSRIAALCPGGGKKGIGCSLKSLECSSQIEPRYQKMLDGLPVSTHYARVETNDRGGTPRRAVVLGWGMTEEESLQLCTAIRESAGKRISGGTVSCI